MRRPKQHAAITIIFGDEAVEVGHAKETGKVPNCSHQ